MAREYTRRGLPLSVIVADFFHWSAMGDYRFDPAEWPDPAAMVAELRELGVELMVSVWPHGVPAVSENYAEFYGTEGLLVGADPGRWRSTQTDPDKGMAAPVPVAFYDPTNPGRGRSSGTWSRRNYLAATASASSGWTRASRSSTRRTPATCALYAGPGARGRQHLPAGQRPRCSPRAWPRQARQPTVLLCRSAWAGSAAVRRGGVVRRHPRHLGLAAPAGPAGLNVAVSGIPWWTTDIGGFHGGDPRDPAYQELMVRWFQYGVFCPLFRLHGDRQPRMPTRPRHDRRPERGLVLRGRRLRAHQRPRCGCASGCGPTSTSRCGPAHATGLPPMRPLFVDFPDDPAGLARR